MNEDNNFNTKINPTSETNKNNNKLKECNNRMETQYSIIKRIYEKKLDAAYIVKEKKTDKKYFIKKNSKKSKKNNFNTIQFIFDDMKKSSNDEIGEQFCMKYLDYWIENENRRNGFPNIKGICIKSEVSLCRFLMLYFSGI